MGRKKRKALELKPFCFYCDREFDDVKVLIQHQKAKHFKCLNCNRKLDTAAGLVVHMLQVHKEPIQSVPNALSGRDNPDIVIHGMEGIPNSMLEEKKKELTDAMGNKNAKKQERVNWTQVTMAPRNMEQFMQQAQQGSLPKFISTFVPPGSGTGGSSGAMNASPGMGGFGANSVSSFSFPGGRLTSPMAGGASAASTMTGAMAGSTFHHQNHPYNQHQLPQGVSQLNHQATSPSYQMHHPQSSASPLSYNASQPHQLQNQQSVYQPQARHRTFGDSPSTSLDYRHNNANIPSQAPSSQQSSMQAPHIIHNVTSSYQLPLPPPSGYPPLPPNVQLMYSDDTFTMEERKAMAMTGIQIGA